MIEAEADAAGGAKRTGDRRVIGNQMLAASTCDGKLEVLAIEVSDSMEKILWTAFLRRMHGHPPSGVQVVISETHNGLEKAIAC